MNIRDWAIEYFKNDKTLDFSEAGNIGNGIERYLNDYRDGVKPDEEELKDLADKAKEFFFQYDMINQTTHERRQGIAELLAGKVPSWFKKDKPNPVKRVCAELGINQKELAEELGVNVSTVSTWATGKIEPPAIVLKCLELLIIEKKFNQLKEIFNEELKK